MKKALGMAVIMLFVGSTTAMAQLANSGTGHDFANATWAGASGTTATFVRGEVCAPCHTPHGGSQQGGAPLWNHIASSASSWSMYSTATMSQTISTPAGVSGLCLGCHDGVTALNAYGGGTGSSTLMTGDAVLGTDLRNDHPISIVYSTANTSDGDKLVDSPGNNVLAGGTNVECSSCHEPHNRGFAMSNNAKYLKVSNVGSALCTTCHSQ